MTRVGALKENTRGVKCEMTKYAFKYLKGLNLKPYLVDGNGAGFFVIRCSIGGRYFEYSAKSGLFSQTYSKGQFSWRMSGSVADFVERACKFSESMYPPSKKQVKYLLKLADEIGTEIRPDQIASSEKASDAIVELVALKNTSESPEKGVAA